MKIRFSEYSALFLKVQSFTNQVRAISERSEMKTKSSLTPILFACLSATFSTNLSEKRCELPGNELKM